MICFVMFLMDLIIIQQNARNLEHHHNTSALEQALMLVASHVGDDPCCCPIVDPRWSFSSQLLSIPFLWHRLPHFKKVSCFHNFLFY
jgi:ubiquitin-protein ligase E3 C